MVVKFINKQIEGGFTTYDIIIENDLSEEILRLIGFNLQGDVIINELEQKAYEIASYFFPIEEITEIIIN